MCSSDLREIVAVEESDGKFAGREVGDLVVAPIGGLEWWGEPAGGQQGDKQAGGAERHDFTRDRASGRKRCCETETGQGLNSWLWGKKAVQAWV